MSGFAFKRWQWQPRKKGQHERPFLSLQALTQKHRLARAHASAGQRRTHAPPLRSVTMPIVGVAPTRMSIKPRMSVSVVDRSPVIHTSIGNATAPWVRMPTRAATVGGLLHKRRTGRRHSAKVHGRCCCSRCSKANNCKCSCSEYIPHSKSLCRVLQ